MSETTTQPALDDLAMDATTRIASSASLADLEALKVELFGKKGAITANNSGRRQRGFTLRAIV